MELANKLAVTIAEAKDSEKKLVEYLQTVLDKDVEITEKFFKDDEAYVTISVKPWDKTSLKMKSDGATVKYQVVTDNDYYGSYSDALSVPTMLYFLISSEATKHRFDMMNGKYLASLRTIKGIQDRILELATNVGEAEEKAED